MAAERKDGGFHPGRHLSLSRLGTRIPCPQNQLGWRAFDGNRSHAGINKPPKQQVPTHNFATAILSKQRALKALFAQDGQRFEITDVREDLPAIICYPRITSITQASSRSSITISILLPYF